MKQISKRYFLRKQVRSDLLMLRDAIDRALNDDCEGIFFPQYSFVPLMFRFVCRYFWCQTPRNMFKKL